MAKRTQLFLLVTGLLILFLPSRLSGQCTNKDQVLAFDTDNPRIEIQQAWGDGSASTYDLELKSATGASFTFKALSLRDAASGNKIDASNVSLTLPGSSIQAGKVAELSIYVSPPTVPGNYEGSFFIYQVDPSDSTGSPQCEWEIPIAVRLYEAGMVSLVDNETPIVVNTVPRSFLNWILPTRIKGQGFSVNVKNEGKTTVQIEDFSLYLQGQQNSNFLSDKNLYLDTTGGAITILPGRTEQVSFTFDKKSKVPVDQYSGQVNLHLANRNETLSTNISINRRMGVFWAIVALLLGIFVGRMIKDVNKAESQTQIQLIEQFIPLRAQVAGLEDRVAKNQLLSQLQQLEQQINQVKGEEDKAKVEAQFPAMNSRVKQIVEWQALFFRVEEKLKNANVDMEDAVTYEIEEELNDVRDLILAGEAEGVKQGLGKVQSLMGRLQGSGTKSRGGLLGDGGEAQGDGPVPVESKGILNSIEEINQNLDKKDTDKTSPTSTSTRGFWSKVEDWFFKAMNFLTGFQVNARVRYAVFRPLAMLVAFIVLVLLGFQEIYVNGSNTFGADGVYDYMKLFLWGLVSDVFSRSLTGNILGDEKVQSFAQVSSS